MQCVQVCYKIKEDLVQVGFCPRMNLSRTNFELTAYAKINVLKTGVLLLLLGEVFLCCPQVPG